VLDDFRVPYELRGADVGRWSRLVAEGPSAGLYWPARTAYGVPGGFAVGEIPIWGRVVADENVAAFAATLEGCWRRDLPVLDARGARHSSIWRGPDGGAILPFDPDEVVLNYRGERYRDLLHAKGGVLHAKGGAVTRASRRLYYLLRPLVPRRLQISMRRAYARLQGRTTFPRWPTETALHDLSGLVLSYVADLAGEPVPYLAPWPDGHTWALVLTHDVETSAGRDGIERVREVEHAAGVRSSWYLVPERYAIDDTLVAHLRSVGAEVGVHGLRHDGRDLESLRTLTRRLPQMRTWAERWNAVGFRAPATQRVWDWMPMLGFDYDSSYPDTDPYEPMPGGCCSWLPFFNGNMVELPITLVQDHTAFVILRRGPSLWHAKTEFLRRRGGMALLLTHPDYLLSDQLLRSYERFVRAYADDDVAWRALPREVSAWWRRRAATSLQFVDGTWEASGPARREARIRFFSPLAGSTPMAS
jgi:hypothetical protein